MSDTTAGLSFQLTAIQVARQSPQALIIQLGYSWGGRARRATFFTVLLGATAGLFLLLVPAVIGEGDAVGAGVALIISAGAALAALACSRRARLCRAMVGMSAVALTARILRDEYGAHALDELESEVYARAGVRAHLG